MSPNVRHFFFQMTRDVPTGAEGLTVELQDRVVHLALDLSGALEGAGHPQPLVHGDGRDDVVPDVRGHLPLRQNGANYQSNQTQEGQGESQNLQTLVGHFFFLLLLVFLL